jgi:hypothetical protein
MHATTKLKPASVNWTSVRAYGTRRGERVPRPRLPERPWPRVNDPLAQSPNATTTEAAPDVTLITRRPPTAPSPLSLTTAPASALLRPPTPRSQSGPLPPTTRDTTLPDPASQRTIQRIRELRTQDPARFTRSVLARMYGVTQAFVGMVAPSKKTYRKEAIRQRDEAHETIREKWGERKSISVEIRRKRREFW